jgi:lipid A 4'-phosphatase
MAIMTAVATRLPSVIRHPAVWIPAVVLALLTAVFWMTDLDTAAVRPFFSGKKTVEGVDPRFPLGHTQPWRTFYNWGVFPALVLGCGGMAVWFVSFFWRKLVPWRDPGLFLGLLLIVGPGIIVNLVCKPFWSRPRPHAMNEFGGPRPFVPVWHRGSGDEDSSFPSGHAAMGFYLMAPAFVCYRRRPWLAAGFLALGLAYGSVIGMARIVAGSHFPSDVLWSGGLIYFLALALAAPFRFGQCKSNHSDCP